MTRPPTIKKRISSGGVIFRISENNIEVVLVAVRGRSWCIPKGIIEKGEDPPAAALREVREETGLAGEILDKIGWISYWFFLKEEMVRIHKTVHFYLLKYIDGKTDDHDDEVDEAKWFTIDEAIKKLSYKSEREIMQKAKAMIEKKLNPES
ncbi:putative mutator protein MutT4 [bacterium BMS3Abin06]|nr:putative mutator protein MutT4 [bacterium BMS3Abin06]